MFTASLNPTGVKRNEIANALLGGRLLYIQRKTEGEFNCGTLVRLQTPHAAKLPTAPELELVSDGDF